LCYSNQAVAILKKNNKDKESAPKLSSSASINISQKRATPVAAQASRNFFTLLPPNKKRDVTLLFDILLLQDHSSTSMTKIPIFISLIQAMCRNSSVHAAEEEVTTDMSHLKEEIITKLGQKITQPKGQYFHQFCNILSNVLVVVKDEEVMKSCISDAKKDSDVDKAAITITPTSIIYILRFVFILLNDCLDSLIEHISTRPLQKGLSYAYMRLANLCKLWRLAIVSFINGEHSHFKEFNNGNNLLPQYQAYMHAMLNDNMHIYY
jgi:hypothetical protein